MSKVIVVTSGKGGVGKTTSTASIGAALAQSGQRVCVVDFDVGLRNLDLVLGAERRVVYDFINVAQGDAKLTQALIRDKRVDTLHLLAASQTRDKDALSSEGVERVIGELRMSFDWVICDSPAGIERGALLAMRFADQAIVVTNPEISSVRDSDRIIGLLDSEDPAGRKRRAHRQAIASDPLRSRTLEPRRDAEHRGRARHSVDPAARRHSGERGSSARFQSRRPGDDQRLGGSCRSRLPRGSPPARRRNRADGDPRRKEDLPQPPFRPEGRMSLFRFFKVRGAAPVARERLQILLAHERVALGPRDLVAILRDELLATIARHVEIDPEKVKVTMDRAGAYSTLEIDVEIPCDKIAAGASRGDVPGRASAA